MPSKIIAFAGRKRAGKDMLAEGVAKASETPVQIIAIADALKLLCCDLIGVDLETLNKWKDDGTTFAYLPTPSWYEKITKETGISETNAKRVIDGMVFTNVRQMLQIIGTELIRKYYNDWHIDKTIEKINSFDDETMVIVDDVRFPNEKRKLEEIGAQIYFVIRPNCWEISNHVSENSLLWTDFDVDHTFVNNRQKENAQYIFNVCFMKKNPPHTLSIHNYERKEAYIRDYTKNTGEDYIGIKFIKNVIKEHKEHPQHEMLEKHGCIYFDWNDEVKATDAGIYLGSVKYNKSTAFGIPCICNPFIIEMLKLYF